MAPNSTPRLGIRVDGPRGVENGTNQNVVPTFLLYFHTDTLYACLAPYGHNTQRGRRQTELSELEPKQNCRNRRMQRSSLRCKTSTINGLTLRTPDQQQDQSIIYGSQLEM